MMLIRRPSLRALSAVLVAAVSIVGLAAQAKPAPQAPTPGAKPAAIPDAVTPPQGYLIGADDVLSINFYRDKDMSADVTVRPDGIITLQLVNDIQAAGLTPDQLRANIVAAASKFFQDPTVTVLVKQINSRRVYITGAIAKPGPYPLSAGLRVAQLIAIAGGPTDWADTKNIGILRVQNGKQVFFKMNYEDVKKGKKIEQNIELLPGDTVIIPE